MIFKVHFNSELFIRRAFYSRLAHLFATNLVRKMTEVKRTPPALCVRLETQCHVDKKNVVTTNIASLWVPPRSAGPKTGHGSPRSEILATPLISNQRNINIVPVPRCTGAVS